MDGLKTYIMSAVLAALGAVDLSGAIDVLPENAGLMTIAFAAAIAGLRHGIAKIQVR